MPAELVTTIPVFQTQWIISTRCDTNWLWRGSAGPVPASGAKFGEARRRSAAQYDGLLKGGLASLHV